MRRIFGMVILALVIYSALGGAWVYADFVPGQIIVKFKPNIVRISKGLAAASIKSTAVATASLRALNAKYQVSKVEQLYRRALDIYPEMKQLQDDFILIFPEDRDVLAAVEEYQKDPSVVSASPNTIVRAFEVIPDDTYFSQQWALEKIKVTRAWDRTTGSAEALIAVLDTGVNYKHEDLKNKVDLTYAHNYISGGSDPLDDNGHGSAVSALIAAQTSNETGIAGMDWKGKILPMKLLDKNGEGNIGSVNTALADLTALKKTGVNIVVINMSLGQYNEGSDKYTEQDFGGLKSRCAEAVDSGMPLIAAAGNGNVDWNTYPAYYSSVLAVAATDQYDQRSVWTGIDSTTGKTQASNYGSWVDVSAPGTQILSTSLAGGYSSNWNGTSLACPMVTGVASLLKAVNPNASIDDIYLQIKDTADNIDAQNPDFIGKLGSGRLNADQALVGVTARISSPASGEIVRGAVRIYGTAEGWTFSYYLLEAMKSGSVETTTIASSSTQVKNGLLGTWQSEGVNGNYVLRLRSITVNATSVEALATLQIDNTSPEATISSPLNSATIAGKVEIAGKAKDDNFDYYTLEYGVGTAPTSYQLMGTYYVGVDNGLLGTWETAGLSGNYTIRLMVRDKTGTQTYTSEVVQIQETPVAVKAMQAQGSLPMTFILPNPFDRNTTAETSFVYYLSGNFITTIYLFDLNGNLIWRKNYAAGEDGGKAGTNNPTWNGYDLYGQRVANGVYIYQVTADQKIIGRGKIIVLN